MISNPVLRHGMATYCLSKPPLTVVQHYLLVLCAVLFLIWPKSQFLRLGSPPLTFSILAIVATLIIAYLSFSYGAAGFVQESEQRLRSWFAAHSLSPRGAIVGLTLLTTMHTFFLLGLALPLLLAASHVSGMTSQSFLKALALILVCTLAYRWLGVLALCLWELREFVRYVVARAAFVVLVLGSAFFLPPVNPLLGLISMTFGDELGQHVRLFGQRISYADTCLIIHLLLLPLAYIMVTLLVRRWLRSAAAPGAQETASRLHPEGPYG